MTDTRASAGPPAGARLTDFLARHPRIPLAVKSAAAASLAWLVVQPLGGVADHYPYYAPLGAVVAMGATVISSVKASLQSIVALLIGAGVGIVVRQLPLAEVVEIACVVAIATLIGAWRLGSMASWVPITALFVLIIGRSDPYDYALAYVGLTALGAAVGVAVNAAIPSLPLTVATVAESKLQETLAGQLEDLAGGLRESPLLSPQQWEERRRAVEPQTEQMRHVVGEASEARRVNWRAHRWKDLADRQYARARALQQLSFLVEDVTALVVHHEHACRQRVPLGPSLRSPAADALEAMGQALRSVEGRNADPEALCAVEEAVNDLVAAIRDVRTRTDDEMFAAGSIVSALRRSVAALAPD